MKITNKQNLPEVFENFANSDKSHPYVEDTYSVTELLGSVREIRLSRKYRDEIEVDVCDMVPALLGTATHKILEDLAPDDIEKEVSLSYKFGKYTVVGRCDVRNRLKKLIGDYKTCSAVKIIKQDFEDWKKQGLAYALLSYLDDIEIRNLEFYALIKDWSKIKASTDNNYPQSPIYVWRYSVNDSDLDEINNFILNKLKQVNDSDIYACSDEERWYTGDKYAVYKNVGDKRALKIFDNEYDANVYADENKCSYVDFRKGENIKCQYYCNCVKFCKKENYEN